MARKKKKKPEKISAAEAERRSAEARKQARVVRTLEPIDLRGKKKGEKVTGTGRVIKREVRDPKTGKLRDVTKKKKRPDKEKEPIKLEKPEKKGLAALVEKDTFAGRAAKILTSPKTTVFLGTVLATLLTAGGAGAAAATTGGRAIISRTATVGARSMTTQRAFVGKASTKAIDKLFKVAPKVAPTASRFATNGKTIATSTSMVAKLGLSLSAAGLFVGAVGSYPFAGFIKEEAVQTLNIAIMQAVAAGDEEGATRLIGEVDEILNNKGGILSKVPYGNVQAQLNTFFDAAGEANEEWKRILEIKGEEAGQPSEFEQAQAESRLRQLERRDLDAQYFAFIREGKFDEAQELLDTEVKSLEGGA